IHLSTRAPMDWARSLHAHHARRLTGLRQTGSAEDLAAGLVRWPMAALTDMTIPGTTVTATDIATLAGQPFGIAQPFVDFLRLSPHLIARLSPVPHLHRSDPAITDRMMALNRSDLNDDALEQAKRAILNRPAKASA
ncbi:MAG: hypothetical protein Q4G49_04595, partial [Paracoccus sp. (in: a-proteobacteria)]|nr:hypothetical protein [Paracoccus sp. (in: a-proteobacteria)]